MNLPKSSWANCTSQITYKYLLTSSSFYSHLSLSLFPSLSLSLPPLHLSLPFALSITHTHTHTRTIRINILGLLLAQLKPTFRAVTLNQRFLTFGTWEIFETHWWETILFFCFFPRKKKLGTSVTIYLVHVTFSFHV